MYAWVKMTVQKEMENRSDHQTTPTQRIETVETVTVATVATSSNEQVLYM